jgi:hypothetical protein
MKYSENLRELLAPLGVYRWEGTFQWSELQSEGEALDGAAEELAELQQEGNLFTARGEGLALVEDLLGVTPQAEGEDLALALAALLRVGEESFTLRAMNDTLRGCGLPAQVEETGNPLRLRVSFPGTAGVPKGFSEMKEVIEGILPCHVAVDYTFDRTTWEDLENKSMNWEYLESCKWTWEDLEGTEK